MVVCEFSLYIPTPGSERIVLRLLMVHQLVCSECLYHWLHALSPCHRSILLRRGHSNYRSHPNISRPCCVVVGCWCEYPWRKWCHQESFRPGHIPALRVLFGVGLFVLHQLRRRSVTSFFRNDMTKSSLHGM